MSDIKNNLTYIEETTSIGEFNILKEEGKISNGNFRVYFETILQTFGKQNRNKRIYSEETGKSIYKQGLSFIDQEIFIGELDHPISDKPERDSKVELKTTSHKFTEIRLVDNVLYGHGFTLSTNVGRDMAALLKDGVKIGFSLRALGFNIKKSGDSDIVNPPIILITYDCVGIPSHKEAVVTKVTLGEAYNIMCKNGVCICNYSGIPKPIKENYERYTSLNSNKNLFLENIIDRIYNSKIK